MPEEWVLFGAVDPLSYTIYNNIFNGQHPEVLAGARVNIVHYHL